MSIIGLCGIQLVKAHRCYARNLLNTNVILELHIFVDASNSIRCGYLLENMLQQWSKCCFYCKVEVCTTESPFNIATRAAGCSAWSKTQRVNNNCHDIQSKDITFWSDSKMVIKWIKCDSRIYNQFIGKDGY